MYDYDRKKLVRSRLLSTCIGKISWCGPTDGGVFSFFSLKIQRTIVSTGWSCYPLQRSQVECGQYVIPYCKAGKRVHGGVIGRTRSQILSVHGQVTGTTEVTRGPNIPCGSCAGKGWLVCDFCEGQKINIQARNNRIYRRCPSCRAAGVVICPRCKVFKCISFPDDKDGGTAL